MDTREWHRKPERGSPRAVIFVTWLYRRLGKRFCDLLMMPVAAYFFLFDHASRRASYAFLDQVHSVSGGARYGMLRRWLLSFRHFYEFARAALDKFAVWQGALSLGDFSFDGEETLQALVRRGQGAVVLSAHLGNIEVLRAISLSRRIKVCALMFIEHNPGFNSALRDSNPDSQLEVISVESLGPEIITELRDRVQRGEIVSLLADRITPNAPEKRVPCRFFQKSADFPMGPFILASLLDCPVFLIFCLRDGPGYRVVFERFADRLEFPRASRAQAVQEVVQRFAARLEHYTSLYPLQWFNFYKFWDNEPG